jgi:hypothetical protein
MKQKSTPIRTIAGMALLALCLSCTTLLSQITVTPGQSVNLCYGTTQILVDMHSLQQSGKNFPQIYLVSADNQQFSTSYNISNGFQITSTGSPSTTVTCYYGYSSTDYGYTFTLTFHTILPAISGPTSLCATSGYTYAVTGNGSYGNYSWSFPSFINPPSNPYVSPETITLNGGGTGTITLTITNGACPAGNQSSQATLNISASPAVPPIPPGLHYTQEPKQCYFLASTYTTPGATSYQWSLNSSFNPLFDNTSGYVAVDYEFMPNSVNTIYVRAANGCGTGGTRVQTVKAPQAPAGCVWRVIPGHTDTPPEEEVEQIALYPNPAHENLQIRIPKLTAALQVEVMDMSGKIVRKYQCNESTLAVDVQELPTGLYVVHLWNDQIQEMHKVQIMH